MVRRRVRKKVRVVNAPPESVTGVVSYSPEDAADGLL